MKDLFYKYIVNLQNNITKSLEEIDGIAKFKEDLWERPEGGGGKTRIIENGNIFEKGGVNISAVHGELPETMQQHQLWPGPRCPGPGDLYTTLGPQRA